MSTWEYKSSTFHEVQFTMSLGFEEPLTLEALRAFVAATLHLHDDLVVEAGSVSRAGHEEVVTLTARRTSRQCVAASGPQPAAAPESETTEVDELTELAFALESRNWFNPKGARNDCA